MHAYLNTCIHHVGVCALQVKDVVEATKELKKRQATPDPPEALACIPSLQLSDIPKEAAAIPSDVSTTSGGTTLLTHDLFTNNVLYAEAALPLGRVPARLLPLLPLFCRCDSDAAARRVVPAVQRAAGSVRCRCWVIWVMLSMWGMVRACTINVMQPLRDRRSRS